MIEPLQSDDALLSDMDTAARGDPGYLHLWWLGQSGFLLQQGGTRLLLDPYLSDSLTRKYADTAKPHVRMTRRVIAPERLAGVEMVFSTHAHTDHLDAETLQAVFATNPGATLVYPAATEALVLERTGEGAQQRMAMRGSDSLRIGEVEIHAIPAAHDRIETDVQGRHKYLGYLIKLLGHTVYHSGDTIVYDGLAALLAPHEIDVALLPINGKVGNMGGGEAAALAQAGGIGLVIPCHYEMFEFNTADPAEQFIPECRRLGQDFCVLRAGERLTLGRGGRVLSGGICP